jgi:uncharacterized protein YuzE
VYIERDKEFDLLYISLGDGNQEGNVAQTKEVSPGVLLDLDAEGKLLGIEIANTKEVIGIPVEELRLSGELLGVKEAAELTGKDRGNFIRDLARKPDFPEPVTQLASGQVWLSKDIEKYLANSGDSNNATSHRDAQEQASDSPTEETSRLGEGDYVYEGGGEEDASSASADDAGFYPNREGPDHEPYSSGSYEQYRGETA